MAVLQNLYQIFKIPSSLIAEHNGNISVYTKEMAIEDGNLVSVGDNIVFSQIRRFYGDTRSHEEIFTEVQMLRKALHQYKKDGDSLSASIINKCIVKILFVQDIINVFVTKKSEYRKFAKTGFDVNGIHYVRFCCGSGQMRRNTITFINEKLYDTLYHNLMCGLEDKITEINIAKYHAYFALAFSSVLWVRTPRVCVIKDFFHKVDPNEPIDFIVEGKTKGEQSTLTRKTAGELGLELNCADGQGLVDPEFGAKWAEDMHLDYVPSSFVVRSSFVKGNLVPFDFRAYAAEHGITKIYDKWGASYNVNEIDVLLSESQFKMHKYYNSWDEYLQKVEAAGIKWGVARYNKKQDAENTLINYQYIQALDIDYEDIKELIAPTVKWINQVCTGEREYALLYMLGVGSEDNEFRDVYNRAQSISMKAVVKNVEFLDDAYIQKKIYKNIIENINKAKIGKLWVRGNYQFMISDPVAQCQAALGLPAVGILKPNQVYSQFWEARRVGCVDLCRSPMIDTHEHNPSEVLLDNAEASKWYKHIKSGIIYNTYDTSTFRHSDSDSNQGPLYRNI